MRMKEKILPRSLAAPSWVFPGSIAENCVFLADRVDEVGLLFMESAPALGYGPDDLPPSLAKLPLRWHVHLPCDLDWRRPEEAAEICLTLMAKADFLGVRRAVLHPPAPGDRDDGAFTAQLESFVRRWRRYGRESRDLLLENLPGQDSAELLAAADALDASLCLDLAHYLLSGGTAGSLPAGLGRRLRLLHLCAPTPDGLGHHRPLADLDEAGRAAGAALCRAAGPETVFMLELFKWNYLVDSLPVLQAWLE